MNEPERTLGRYRLLELLGEGGMGAVYRARDERLGRLVALKVVRASAVGAEPDAEAFARLMREARAAAALTHPNIVALYDVDVHDGVPCIAMELVEGPSLRRLIGGDASPAQRVEWLRQIAEALSAAHAIGIVHRDIKPDNVVLRDGRHAKVLDFGLARAVALEGDADTVEAPHLATITREDRVIGTPAYMAPEQIRGDALDGRCDQFAWGVMAYEVLGGALPWRSGLTSLGLLAAVLTDPAPALVVPGVPRAVVEVIERAMSKSAAERFASMDELLRALQTATGETPAEAASAAHDAPSAASADTEVAARTRLGLTGPSDAPEAAPIPTPAARTAVVDPVVERRRLPRGLVGAVAAAVALGAIAVAATRWVSPHETMPPTPTTAPSAVLVPTPRTIENEPPPTSTDDHEALDLYRRGRLLQRECDWLRALPLFEQAVRRDPHFGEAQFQVAQTRWGSVTNFGVDAETRAAYRLAVDERPRMSARDRALVEALEPLFARDPPDWPAAIASMKRLAAERPDDAEIRLRYAGLRGISGDYDIEADIVAACELDPDYADAWQTRMYVEIAAGRTEAAAHAADQCHRIAPNSRECSWTAMAIFAFIGRCDDAEREGRRHAGTDVTQSHGALLLGLERPRATVEKAFEVGWATAGALRPLIELKDRATMALAAGDFVAAETLARSLLEATAAGQPGHDEAFHWTALETLAIAMHEAGTLKSEAKLFREELRRHKEWETAAPFYLNGTMAVWGVLRREGLATLDEASAARDAVRERYADVFSKHPTLSWTLDCEAAQTEDEARAVVAGKPTLAPGELLNNHQGRAFIGRTLLAAGDVAGAVPWLRQAATSCIAWSRPGPYVEAHHDLGRALEAENKKEEACETYRFVLRHWGEAKPRSKTADAVRKRATALGCARP